MTASARHRENVAERPMVMKTQQVDFTVESRSGSQKLVQKERRRIEGARELVRALGTRRVHLKLDFRSDSFHLGLQRGDGRLRKRFDVISVRIDEASREEEMDHRPGFISAVSKIRERFLIAALRKAELPGLEAIDGLQGVRFHRKLVEAERDVHLLSAIRIRTDQRRVHFFPKRHLSQFEHEEIAVADGQPPDGVGSRGMRTDAFGATGEEFGNDEGLCHRLVERGNPVFVCSAKWMQEDFPMTRAAVIEEAARQHDAFSGIRNHRHDGAFMSQSVL